ncbi:MAG: hypothetical protein METHAR1v1_1820004 [Methanothrix sp.]|nr:MAG: hypothetical protein METHAR1v1_1820004 [Methanothrix sp.]
MVHGGPGAGAIQDTRPQLLRIRIRQRGGRGRGRRPGSEPAGHNPAGDRRGIGSGSDDGGASEGMIYTPKLARPVDSAVGDRTCLPISDED